MASQLRSIERAIKRNPEPRKRALQSLKNKGLKGTYLLEETWRDGANAHDLDWLEEK